MSEANPPVPGFGISARKRCPFAEKANQYRRYCTTLAIESSKNRKLILGPMLGVPGNLIYVGSKRYIFYNPFDDFYLHTFLSRASSCKLEM